MKLKILAALLLMAQLSFGQDKNELIELGKIYRYHGSKEYSSNEVKKKIEAISSPQLIVAKKFVAAIVDKGRVGTKEYLTKPDSVTLKCLYLTRAVTYNLYNEHPKENEALVDSLLNEHTAYHELVSAYYGMIFSRLLASGDGFDMTDVNFELNQYNLKDDTEKGIFFLEAMERLGTLIWGYMNIPKPPNYKKALQYIDKYPRFNGQPYYLYNNLDINNFDITKDKTKPKESFKKYYLTLYMNTLLYHLVCLSQPDADQLKKQDVLNRSIIMNEIYWPYYKNPEVLREIFKGK